LKRKPVPCKQYRARAGKEVAQRKTESEIECFNSEKSAKWCKIQVVTHCRWKNLSEFHVLEPFLMFLSRPALFGNGIPGSLATSYAGG
jgi:hypothetical protein